MFELLTYHFAVKANCCDQQKNVKKQNQQQLKNGLRVYTPIRHAPYQDIVYTKHLIRDLFSNTPNCYVRVYLRGIFLNSEAVSQ